MHLTRPKLSLSSSLALALVLLAGTARAAHAATIVYTNDVLGELEPCGCRSNPLGGMARKANLLKRIGDPSILQLDAGDLLFPSDTLPAALAKQSELQAGYLIHAMDNLGQDAAVPGEKDYALGFKVFERLRKKAKFKFLAANLRKKSGGSYLPAHEIFVRKGKDGKKIRIAVFGLVGADLTWPKELKATPPIAAAKREVRELRKKADVIVALTHEGFDADVALAKAVPGIQAIIGGHTQSFLQDVPKIGSTFIYQSSFRNQYVGVLPVTVPFTGEGENLVGLDAGYDSPAGSPDSEDKIVADFKAAVADLNKKEDPTLEPVAVADEHGAPKFQTFPKCSECHLKQYDFWRKTPHADALMALIKQKQAFNKECISCHTVGFADKQGFETVGHLAERRKEGSPDSSSGGATDPISTEDLAQYLHDVHEAGSLDDKVKLARDDKDSMPIRRSISSITRSWAPVQCENCHMPGRDHPFGGAAYTKTVPQNVCLKCHTPERAPEWYTKDNKPDWVKIAAKRALVTCPAGDFPPSQ